MQKILCCALALAAVLLPAAGTDRVRKTFHDNDAVLINPMMGWVYEFYSCDTDRYPLTDPQDKLDDFPGCSTIYFRLNWADLERRDGVIDWSVIDGPAQRWIARGKQIALRFCTSFTGSRYGGTPQWVEAAGAKMVSYRFKGAELMDPVFDDPVYLAKFERFLTEAGKRYNGNPHVAFVDIGFGTWGEGHTLLSQKLPQPENERLARLHAELYLKYFPDTLLVISDDVIGPYTPGEDFPFLQELRKQGVTLRDDSILVRADKPWYHEALAQRYWPSLPVVLEHEHLQPALARNVWNSEELLWAVETHHAAYLSVHGWPRQEHQVLGGVLDRIDRRLGYRIDVREIDYPAQVVPGTPFEVTVSLADTGVAPCYPGGTPTLTLKNSRSEIITVLTDPSFDLRMLPVGEAGKAPVKTHTATLEINPRDPTLVAGEYDLYLSFGTPDGTPRIALPLPDGDGARRYRVGRIRLGGDARPFYAGRAAWIWEATNANRNNAAAYLTREVELTHVPASALLLVAIDDAGEVFVNGKRVMTPSGWSSGVQCDVTPYLKPGKNLLAIRALNKETYSGVLCELKLTDQDGACRTVSSDGGWKSSPAPAEGWESRPEVSAGWGAARELLPYGEGAWGPRVRIKASSVPAQSK